MLTSLKIEGFRGFQRFEMSRLGRINLLVGTNNSGKTSVLEALHLLYSAADPAIISQTLWRRGETVPAPPRTLLDRPAGRVALADPSHLFFGHDCQSGARFKLSSESRTVKVSVGEMPRELRDGDDEEESSLPGRLALFLSGSPKPPVEILALTRSLGLSVESYDALRGRPRRRLGVATPSQFITTESLTPDELVSYWNRVSLTPEEDLVLKSLRFLDAGIERIAAVAPSQAYYQNSTRSGFIVKRKGQDRPVPIGSMGDGMWRMLAMAVALTQCRGGVLLVDEIDTGLHYSVMSKMWGLVYRVAIELNVQVFATTHSYDCVYTLAQIHSDDANRVTVQRIEPDKEKAVPYDEDELAAAASSEIEVR